MLIIHKKDGTTIISTLSKNNVSSHYFKDEDLAANVTHDQLEAFKKRMGVTSHHVFITDVSGEWLKKF